MINNGERPWMIKEDMWRADAAHSRDTRYPRKHAKWKREHLITYHAVAMQASKGKHSTEIHFDTDSSSIGVDNRASACISHEPTDFIGELRAVSYTHLTLPTIA